MKQKGRRAFFAAQSLRSWVPLARQGVFYNKALRPVSGLGGPAPTASVTRSPRLWAASPGATPARLCEHTMKVGSRSSN